MAKENRAIGEHKAIGYQPMMVIESLIIGWRMPPKRNHRKNRNPLEGLKEAG